MNGHYQRIKSYYAKFINNPLGCLISLISFEFLLLTKSKRPNGGDIILARAFLSSLLLYLLAIGIRDFTYADSTFSFSMTELKNDVNHTLSWYGAIFAAMYAGLYARFASQWSYLANLYNQIKATEIRSLTSLAEKNPSDDSAKKVMQALAEWKAGFVEDAENLHLATKKSIVATIWFWLREDAVKRAYLAATPGGKERYQPLMNAVKKVADNFGGIKGYDELKSPPPSQQDTRVRQYKPHNGAKKKR